jgi:hypothetical protein
MALVALLRSVAVSLVAVAAYFVLPFTNLLSVRTASLLAVGTVVLAVLLVWQVRAITRSRYPVVQGIGAVILIVPLFFVVFATAYYAMGQADPAGWSEPLTRLDALYFTVTVFATVGFGDIVATSQAGRAVVLTQMLGNLVVIGVITRVIVQAIQRGVARQQSEVASGPATGDDRDE